jgi:PIN domain nuclease of toxin-antitoxin system
MNACVLDTHVLWWYLTDALRKLSRSIRRALEEAEQGEALLYISVMVLFELWDLNERLGRPFDFRLLLQALQQSGQFVIVPLDVDDVLAYDDLAAIPGSRDRMIATATRKMAAPLITVDEAIRASGAVPVFEP